MQASPVRSNPFALMMDPESVFEALRRSDRLERLASRICRPLDDHPTPIAGSDQATGVQGARPDEGDD